MFTTDTVLFPQDGDALDCLPEYDEKTKYLFTADASVMLFPYTEDTYYDEELEDDLPFINKDDANCKWLDSYVNKQWAIEVNDGYAFRGGDIDKMLEVVLDYEWPEVKQLANVNTADGASGYTAMDAADLEEVEVAFNFLKPMTCKELANVLNGVHSNFIGDGLDAFVEIDVVDVIDD